MTTEEELAGLLALKPVFAAYEVNTVLIQRPGDVLCVAAMDVPDASEICFASGQGYDVWRRGELSQVKLDVGAAANVVIMEYMTEKVRRSKRGNPELQQYTDDELLAHLLRGYQRSGTQVAS